MCLPLLGSTPWTDPAAPWSAVWRHQALAGVLALLVGTLAAPHACAGQGEKIINTLDDLQAMQQDLAGHYALGQSIEASAAAGWNGGAGFVPIGNAASPFTGHFNGHGHAIRGLFIHRPGESHVGLFGHARNATLRNMRLVGGRVTGAENVGALVGHHEALDGQARIERVCADVQVTGADNVGGLLGHNEAYNGDNHVERAHASGSVRASGSNAGGLVGHNEAYGGRASIADSLASGPVKGRDYVGGLVGYNDALRGSVAIARSHALGAVSAAAEVAGGLVGLNTNGQVTHSFYAITDGRGRAINRFAAGAGQGLTREQLQQLLDFAPQADPAAARCDSLMTD